MSRLLTRLFGGESKQRRSDSLPDDGSERARQVLIDHERQWGCIQVSGTTTFAREHAVSEVLDVVGKVPGYAVVPGWVSKDRTSEFPDSGRVHLSERGAIGALFGGLSEQLDMLQFDIRVPVRVQLFLSETTSGPRVDAWIWAGPDAPAWRYSENSRPPTTTAERANESHRENTTLVRDGLASGGHRAPQFRAGMVDGRHYLELVEPIRQLKREGRLSEALKLCYQAIQGAENEAIKSGMAPPPSYTIDAAIIHRKLQEPDKEIAVLERWMAAAPDDQREGSKVAQRLDKLRGKSSE